MKKEIDMDALIEQIKKSDTSNHQQSKSEVKEELFKDSLMLILLSLKSLASSLIYSSVVVAFLSAIIFLLYDYIICLSIPDLPPLSYLDIFSIFIILKIFKSF